MSLSQAIIIKFCKPVLADTKKDRLLFCFIIMIIAQAKPRGAAYNFSFKLIIKILKAKKFSKGFYENMILTIIAVALVKIIAL